MFAALGGELAEKAAAANSWRKVQVQKLAQAKAGEQAKAQVMQGRANVTPLPIVATQPYRATTLVEGLGLFVVDTFKEQWWRREETLKHTETDEPITVVLLVGKETESSSHTYGVLKAKHQRAFAVLQWLWAKKGSKLIGTFGKPVAILECTQYELVKALRGELDKGKIVPMGGNHYNAMRHLLKELTYIPFTRTLTYEWQNETEHMTSTLLGEVTWSRRRKGKGKGEDGQAKVEILFSTEVTKQFLAKQYKTCLLKPLLELGTAMVGRGGIAPLLYQKLDHELATKDSYHIKLGRLFAELGLREYGYKSARKRKLLPALKLLTGRPILGERYVLAASIREAKDGTDFVLEATRKTNPKSAQ